MESDISDLNKQLDTFSDQIKKEYTTFFQEIESSIKSLKTQIAETEQHLSEAVDRCCESGLPPTVPKEVQSMMECELEEYTREIDRVFNEEINKLQKYHILSTDDFVKVKQPNLNYVDNGISSYLFTQAIDHTDQLCKLLSKDIKDNIC
ncbi:hypothetical protein EIN_248750 [Entamoeba invadens IP1]|uniref:Uncharacterized protein n=1 Tax=Entamoeba invadens IP1 TaxID=370355 RepID=A0A0A1UE29_ENTIV|nr:hypothetical protein EIN_248750 [Entamoeba invadens IP1]ELP94861.1 hypothetical protein EIN_248750 [Entamoeba invadens IP1]|eukprot:XP_004261632.1 hypothetical protein EIN_248750 [Entamoeba invadens IP1]